MGTGSIGAHIAGTARAFGMTPLGFSRTGAPAEPFEQTFAADELHTRQDFSDATWSKLRERWSDAELVEIPFVVGHYTMLSMVANATGVPLEPGLPALPDPS